MFDAGNVAVRWGMGGGAARISTFAVVKGMFELRN